MPTPDRVSRIRPPLAAASDCRSLREAVRRRARFFTAQAGHQLPAWTIAGLVFHRCPLMHETIMTEFMPEIVASGVSRRPFLSLIFVSILDIAFLWRVSSAALRPQTGHQWPSRTLDGRARNTWPSAHSQRRGSIVLPDFLDRHLPPYRRDARSFQKASVYFVVFGMGRTPAFAISINQRWDRSSRDISAAPRLASFRDFSPVRQAGEADYGLAEDGIGSHAELGEQWFFCVMYERAE